MAAFAWRSRKKQGGRASRPARKLPPKTLAPVHEIVEQGLLVADVALRMSVKNAIIMNALRRNVDYNEDQVKNLVREKAKELARERGKDAKHIRRVRDEIKKYGRSAWSETEYGSGDNRTLKHRQEVYEHLSEELSARARDEAFVSQTAEEARQAAWREIGDSLANRATHPYYSGGGSEEYKRERDGRIQLLIERDLTDLMRGKDQKKSRWGRKKDKTEKDKTV